MTSPFPSSSKALIFDLIGTCTDWYSSILAALESAPHFPSLLDKESLPRLAADWRAGFFREVSNRRQAGQPIEDIDVTHRRVLNWVLLERGVTPKEFTSGKNDFLWREGNVDSHTYTGDDGVRSGLVAAWHDQSGWPDALEALNRLKKQFFIVVLANGSTRLQLDVIKSSGLPFHTLLSSELLGKTKPDAAMYRKALDLLKVAPAEATMVAAHAYDVRAAKKVGMKTVYIKRGTEDKDEDMGLVRKEVDFFLDGTKGSTECGLAELADILGA